MYRADGRLKAADMNCYRDRKPGMKKGRSAMRRRTYDTLAVGGALVIAAILLVAGGLLTWGHSFVTNEVHTQLAAQKIVFPANNSPAIKAPEFAAMHQYAGQLMTTGAQAEVYADHFIANHLKEIGGGKTYAQLSEVSLANPKNAALAAQVQTVFRGETLRGLLLNAYAFGTMGMIAGIAAIGAFIGAGLMLILSMLGIWHLRRVAPQTEVFAGPAGAKAAGAVPAHTA
jgi:hypothetical protein